MLKVDVHRVDGNGCIVRVADLDVACGEGPLSGPSCLTLAQQASVPQPPELLATAASRLRRSGEFSGTGHPNRRLKAEFNSAVHCARGRDLTCA